MPAIAKNRNSICQYQRFLERVRNEDDRNAATLQIAHEVEEILLFFRRKGCRGLVEDYDFGLVQDGACYLDHLLLGGAEKSDGRGRSDVEIERLQELLGGDVNSS